MQGPVTQPAKGAVATHTTAASIQQKHAQQAAPIRPRDRAAELSMDPTGESYARISEGLSAQARNNAQKDLAEAQTAQACVATAAQAKTANLDVKLPKVCDKYVKPTTDKK